MSRRRLDQFLVEQGLAPSRTRARDLIEAGQVSRLTAQGREVLRKASLEIAEDERLEIAEGEADRFVSRGGLKLAGALGRISLDPRGLAVLDVGQSTGGFSDCLLQAEAALVVGVDVGRDQLHPRLRSHPRLKFFEGINARDLRGRDEVRGMFPQGSADLIVMDLSFISQTLVFPVLDFFARPGTRLLSLVKPQFEVGPSGLGKGGIVKDPLLYDEVERKMKQALTGAGWKVLSYFESPLTGKDGNKEFFIHGVWQ
ncbi:MAG: TlyA family RNA methyltransferase [Bdellovibrionaceae bacterium]|nr:TlyA family RNA methyltransferase [Pseudobdellovibrionaceae bacterium]